MWALDLGTTNSLLARWDRGADRPVVLELPGISRLASEPSAHDVSRAVPSAVQVLESPGLLARFGASPFLTQRLFLGRLARIGQEAAERNRLLPRPNFVSSFKRQLAHAPLLTVARAAGRAVSAREAAFLFVRELFAHAKARTGERIRELVVTSPVEAFETYRAEVSAICQRLGVRRVQFVDEPVAAALGYGLGLGQDRNVLVADFGGGTLHLALVRLGAASARAGQATVLAKAGRDLGGNLVDRWLLHELCRRLHFDPAQLPGEEGQLWTALMLAEARRVKEAVYFDERAAFEVSPPESVRRLEERAHGQAAPPVLDRPQLVQLLEQNGLYAALRGCLDEVLQQGAARGVQREQIDEVLMVGGSTLLPGIYRLFEDRFGRDKVRAWQPFEAVAHGGAVFAAGRVEAADFIVHDYALLTHGLRSGEVEHAVVIPRGTSFPTRPDFWKGQLVPTCALGEPERVFKLVVCEIGSGEGGRKLAWDAAGKLHALGEPCTAPIIVKLNEQNPALGRLDPPHSPGDKKPRLELALGVNGERWLCATVHDLRTRKVLMRDEPVVRLL